jgi:uncharacterized protein (TIGR00255 family)
MIHSMTAFARAEQAGANGTLSWELRSVNHRYLEPHLRLPEAFRDLEGAVREALRNGLSRGKVECTLRFSDDSTGKTLQVDLARAAQLVAAAESVASLIKQPAALNPLEVLGWPGVLVADAADPQALNQRALNLFTQALNDLKTGREREGAELAKLLNERLDSILEQVIALRELVPQMLASQRQKILDRCAEMQVELDPQRLEQELVMLAQKSDVAEELDRPRHRSAAGAQSRRPSGPPPGFSDAGTQPRSQHPRFQGLRHPQHPGCGELESADRADARTSTEHRISQTATATLRTTRTRIDS